MHDQLKCTLKHQLHDRKRIQLNAMSSPYVAINFNNVISYNGMFAFLTELEDVVINSFDTRYITSMEEMFNGCINLRKIAFVNCDLSNVKSMRRLCNNCASLEVLQFEDCKINPNCDYTDMLNSCPISVTIYGLNYARDTAT